MGGVRAKRAWGSQFIKLLELLYKSIQETSDQVPSESQEVNPKQVGASGLDGRPGRVKVALEIEKVLGS